jgi:hypothetical protein
VYQHCGTGGEKPYDFPRPTIRSGESALISGLFPHSGSPSDGKIQKQNAKKNFTVRFTVKTMRLGAIDAETRRKVIIEILVSYAREPIDGDRPQRPNSLPLNRRRRQQSLEKPRIPSAQIQLYRQIDRQNILLGADR